MLYGYQGADTDAEQLALTEQLFDATLGELGVVARGQPRLIVGDVNVEPTKIPVWLKEFLLGSGLTWMLPARWLRGLSPLLPVSVLGIRLAVNGGILWLVVLMLLQRVLPAGLNLIGGLYLIWLVGRILTVVDGPVRLPGLFNVLLWLASWLPAVEKSRGSKSAKVLRVWEVYDDRLHFMARSDASEMGESLRLDDVSGAWMIWSGAAENAFADAFQLAGGPVPVRGLVLGRGSARFRVVRLGRRRGRPMVRKARRGCHSSWAEAF